MPVVASPSSVESSIQPTRTAADLARIDSLDLWRGVVMVLMAIDHVRVYSGVPAGGPSPGVFFTRWITHFCAPGFVFLAGTAACLYARKASASSLSRYLLTRGLLLVLLELTVIRLSWTFSVSSLNAPLAGVIWMLGWCMVLMAALVRLPLRAILVLGLLIVFAQDAVRPLAQPLPPQLAWIGQFLYTGGDVQLGASGPSISILYSIVPWIGVMALGYAFGAVMTWPAQERRRFCFSIGGLATAVFLMAGIAVFTLTSGQDGTPRLFVWLNQRKYPASQLYLLMTLGPPILLLPLAEHARGAIARCFTTFGRVPLFYYLLHIPLIHAVSLLAWRLRDGQVNTGWFLSAPYVSVEPEARWSLGLLYLVFAISVALLYVACRWYAEVKGRHRTSLLRYL